MCMKGNFIWNLILLLKHCTVNIIKYMLICNNVQMVYLQNIFFKKCIAFEKQITMCKIILIV
jgi:hypothetical protein